MGVALALSLGLLTFVARLTTAAGGPTDWDSVQYVVGSQHFDVTHGAPQPPGYWLYVATGHVLSNVTGASSTTCLVVLAALASAAAAALTCAAGMALFGRWTGLAAGALVATAPVSWFTGSIVSTYSFDALVAAALVLVAWHARPGSVHGSLAVVVYGLGGGFRPTVLEMFLPLVLIAVVAGTRSVRQAGLVVAVALASMAVWFVPMIAVQPGGFSAWLHATHSEAAGAAQASSVFVNRAGGITNIGTFAAWTLLTLGPAVVVGALALLARMIGSPFARRKADAPPQVQTSHAVSDANAVSDTTGRPWFQSRTAILLAAVIPPVAVVTAIQFAKGGYVLAYLPAATLGVLAPVAWFARHPRPAYRRTVMAVFTAAVLVACALNVERFTEAPGILPTSFASSHPGWWISQARYQAPYPDTNATIEAADVADRQLVALARHVDPRTDVVVSVAEGNGLDLYRNMGYAAPGIRLSLVSFSPPDVLYTELHGLLYYDSGSVVAVGPGGAAYFLTAPPAPDLAGAATRLGTVSGFQLWRVTPGHTVFGIRVVTTAGNRPLGSGTP